MGGTIEEAADILGDSEAIVRKHYAKWSRGRQSRITTLPNKLCTILAHKEMMMNNPSGMNGIDGCPGWDLNPHSPYGERDFKSLASAGFATRAY